MERFQLLTSLLISFFSLQSFANTPAAHAKHNMVLFGEAHTYYASHLVYKAPHNYQVILKLDLDASSKTKLGIELQAHPQDQFIFLLDHMDISQIELKPTIAGQIFRNDSTGAKHVIFESVHLSAGEYSVIFFNELPLSLAP